MKQIIGFANEYYTLWDYENKITYTTNAYGQHFPSGGYTNYYFRKNISKDLNKVKTLYPDLSIDESVRGKHRSFRVDHNIELPVEYFWVGKYKGELIEDVLKKDMGYCEWAVENLNYKVKDYIKSHPIYVYHIATITKQKEESIKSAKPLSAGDEIELEFTTNGFMGERYEVDSATGDIKFIKEVALAKATAENSECVFYVEFPDYKNVNGRFPYIMPQVNGKCCKTKAKKFVVKIVEVGQPNIDRWNNVTQRIVVS